MTHQKSINSFRCISYIVAVSIALLLPAISFAQSLPTFTKFVVFGDSLSDTGNIAHRVRDKFHSVIRAGASITAITVSRTAPIRSPARISYAGVWHEQLAHTFLHLPIATNSLDGGTNYAFGGATTVDGTSERTVIHNPDPFAGGDYTSRSITWVSRSPIISLLSTPDPNALYLLWGGGNDLFDDSGGANVIATSNRINTLIRRLATAGARNFLVPNVPPLGAIPNYKGHTSKIISLDAASADYRTILNSGLNATISALAAQGITVHIYRLDTWLNTIRILAEPSNYGFTEHSRQRAGRCAGGSG